MEKTGSSRWIRCPFCDHQTTIKVYPETVLLNFPLCCTECGREVKVNVVQLKMVIAEEKNA